MQTKINEAQLINKSLPTPDPAEPPGLNAHSLDLQSRMRTTSQNQGMFGSIYQHEGLGWIDSIVMTY